MINSVTRLIYRNCEHDIFDATNCERYSNELNYFNEYAHELNIHYFILDMIWRELQ